MRKREAALREKHDGERREYENARHAWEKLATWQPKPRKAIALVSRLRSTHLGQRRGHPWNLCYLSRTYLRGTVQALRHWLAKPWHLR